MIKTAIRRRIEVLVDRPLMPEVIRLAKEAGVTAYTILRTEGGAGAGGVWHEEQVTGVQSKQLFLAVTSEEKSVLLAEKLAPLLESHGLVLLLSDVSILRSDKFQ